MKYGIVLPTYAYDIARVALISQAFDSLRKTRSSEGEKPKLMLIIRQAGQYVHNLEGLDTAFDLEVLENPFNIYGTEHTLAYGTQKLFEQEMDYVTWMGDDALFHPDWHLRLKELIAAKPEAKAWSVYRSAYESIHSTLEQDNGYVRVKSLCGHCLTMSRQEWVEWGIRYDQGPVWMSVAGDTLDLHHAHFRPGERWVTEKSYVEHTGRSGVHCHPGLPEYAVAFQGVEG